MYGSTAYASKSGYGDIESGAFGTPPALYPGVSPDENLLRWAFIRKVYGILSTQLILTAAVAATVVFSEPVKHFVLSTPYALLFIGILPLILLCPLSYYHQHHPLNLILLGLWTVSLAVTIGLTCAFVPGTGSLNTFHSSKSLWSNVTCEIVLEALILTSVVVVCLTIYTYWAVQQGHDFSFLGPFLFAGLLILVVWGLIQMFFPLGQTGRVVYGALGALLFCAYIIYDTDNLIQRYSYDEYIWASIALYLDIVNIFLYLLQILRDLQGSGSD
eukprot:SM000281S10745  [mRNA]  locus=s281:131442:133294:+ [translate_table: standard]